MLRFPEEVLLLLLNDEGGRFSNNVRCARNTFGSASSATGRHSFRSWARTFTIPRGFPAASSDCLAHFPSTEAFMRRSSTIPSTQPIKACCNCSKGTPANAREIVGIPNEAQGFLQLAQTWAIVV